MTLLAVPAAFVAVLFAVPAAVLATGLRGDMLATLTAGRTWQVVGFTILQAAPSTLATLVIALPAAIVLARPLPRPGCSAGSAYFVPFVMPTVVVAAFLALIGPNGLLGIDLSGLYRTRRRAHVPQPGGGRAGGRPVRARSALGGRRARAGMLATAGVPARHVAPDRAVAQGRGDHRVLVLLHLVRCGAGAGCRSCGRWRSRSTGALRNLLDLPPAAAALSLLQLLAVLAMLAVVGATRSNRTPPAIDPARRPVGWERPVVWLVAAGTSVLVLAPLAAVLFRSLRIDGLDARGLADAVHAR